MHFVWYIISLICFGWVYWFLLSLLIGLPGMGIAPLLIWASEGKRTITKKILFAPIMILSFILGTFLYSLTYSAGMAAISISFAEKASHPLVYLILGGFASFTIMAPSGESSFLASLLSLICYILFISILKFQSTLITAGMLILVDLILGIFLFIIVVGIIFGMFGFINKFILKRIKGVND